MRKFIIIVLLLLLAAIIWRGFKQPAQSIVLDTSSSTIKLADALPGNWQRVCVVGPYSSNRHAHEITGIPVKVQQRSSIYTSDSIALLVTLTGQEEIGLFEISRGNVDFASLGGRCFDRVAAIFQVERDGHPSVTPVSIEENPADGL
ncbi:MAG: hypothetical protein ACWA5Q_10765 [bacterium]